MSEPEHKRGASPLLTAALPQLDPQLSVADVLRMALVGPLRALRHNLVHAGPREPEFVHQARVSVRRLRTSVRAFRAMSEVRPWRDDLRVLEASLRALNQVLGEARDADIFQGVTLDTLRVGIGPDLLPTLATVATRAEARRVAAYAAMAALPEKTGDGPVFLLAERLMDELSSTALAGTRQALTQVAKAQLLKAHARVMRAARHPERLGAPQRHRLRIAVKRLRYLADVWASLWPQKRSRRYLMQLEKLQQALGALNDAAVAGRALRQLKAGAALRAVWRAHEKRLLAREMPRVARRLAALEHSPAPWR
ncbi:MAG: CHAD domain-containing protein [Burkholderiales bacterium]|nr:CHAD domain-containing protein [Burkholderiales bacterium]